MQQTAPHARWLVGHTREAAALPEEVALAVLVGLLEGVPAETVPVALLLAVAVAELVAAPLALPLAVNVAVPDEASEAVPLAVDAVVPDEAPEAVPLAVADAVADALAVDAQEGCCTHCPTLLQNQQGAHVALELHVAAQVSVDVWQA